MPKPCPFCAIVAGDAPARIVREWPDAIAWLPRSGGCTPGHTLIVPRAHVAARSAAERLAGS